MSSSSSSPTTYTIQPNDSNTEEALCYMAYWASEGTDETRIAMARHRGCVDALVSTANDGETVTARVLSVICLQWLAYTEENQEPLIAHPGILDALAKRAKELDGDGPLAENVACESFEALRWLAKPGENRLRLFEHSGVMEAVLGALKNEEKCHMHEHCLLLLEGILSATQNAERTIQTYPQIVDVLLKFLSDDSETRDVKELCLGQLVFLCGPTENKEYMFDREDVVAVLLTEWPEIKMRHYCLFALNFLSVSDANKRKMTEHPVVKRAVHGFATNLLPCDDPEVGSIVSRAISQLEEFMLSEGKE